MITTVSICLACHKEIPAVIEETWDGVFMTQKCPVCGDKKAIVEESVAFHKAFGYRRNKKTFNSLMLDITDACNTNCKLCYHPRSDTHKGIIEILRTAAKYSNRNIWLSGGEPTCHPELFNIISCMSNFKTLITNGHAFADMRYLQEFIELTGDKKEFPCEISINPNPHKLTLECLSNLRSLGKTIDCGMFSISSLRNIEKSLDIWGQWLDVVTNARIRTPFNVWGQQANKTLFMSEVYKEVISHIPRFVITEDLGGNSIYNINLKADRYLSLCSAPNRNAFDVLAVSNAPDMLADDNNIYPIPYGLMVNEFIGDVS